MKMNIKRIIATLLFVLLMITITPNICDFNGNVKTAEAATVKISKKKATLIKGQTLKLKITGTKTKVKWSSSKKSVATVSSKGVVKAKKKGTATITAKVGKKKYKCVITVKNKKKFSEKEALKNISIDRTIQEDVIYYKVKNNYYYRIGLHLDLEFYNENGDIIDLDMDQAQCIDTGGEYIFCIWMPEDDNNNPLKYSRIKAKWSVSDASYNEGHDKLTYSYHYGNNNIIVEVKNNTKHEVYFNLSIIMYRNGKISPWSACNTNYIYPGETIYKKFNLPYDEELDSLVKPDNIEIYIG